MITLLDSYWSSSFLITGLISKGTNLSLKKRGRALWWTCRVAQLLSEVYDPKIIENAVLVSSSIVTVAWGHSGLWEPWWELPRTSIVAFRVPSSYGGLSRFLGQWRWGALTLDFQMEHRLHLHLLNIGGYCFAVRFEFLDSSVRGSCQSRDNHFHLRNQSPTESISEYIAELLSFCEIRCICQQRSLRLSLVWIAQQKGTVQGSDRV